MIVIYVFLHYIFINMKKQLIIAFTIGSGLMILDSVNAGQALMMFLFNGIIPGTNLTLSPTLMLIIMSSAGIVTTAKFIAQPIKQRLVEIEKTQVPTNSKKFKHA